MTRQHDLAAEAVRRGATPGRGYAFARAVSQVLHPVVLGVASTLIVGLLGVTPVREGVLWALVCIFLQIVPGTIFFMIRLRQGAYTDEDISVRTQRNELYIFGIANMAIGLVALRLLGAPPPILAMVAAATLLSVLGWAINLRWKISVHASTMGSTATLASLHSVPLGLALWLCALVLGWARVRTRNHTPLQVVAGLALAVACVVGTFTAFGLGGG